MTIIPSNLLLERRWSMTHGFFMIMGGFHLFQRSAKETSNDQSISQDDQPLHPLEESDLWNCDGYESFILPTEKGNQGQREKQLAC